MIVAYLTLSANFCCRDDWENKIDNQIDKLNIRGSIQPANRQNLNFSYDNKQPVIQVRPQQFLEVHELYLTEFKLGGVMDFQIKLVNFGITLRLTHHGFKYPR